MAALSRIPVARSSARLWLRRSAIFLGVVVVAIAGILAWNLRPPAVSEPRNFAPPSEGPAPVPIRLRVLTWNVWGLRWISPRREERLAVIAREIATAKPDIVGLQEAFVAADRAKIIAALDAVGLKHARYFQSGLVGSGLLLLSRFPIESDGFIRYAQNGNPAALSHGDWWAGKGLSLSILRLPNGLPLCLGNTHLHARYRENRYHETQLAQSAQLVPWVLRVQAAGGPALWLGDWNNTLRSDVLTPLRQAGDWKLLTRDRPRIDLIFGSGSAWEWSLIGEGRIEGFLDEAAQIPWSDHAGRWVEVELRPATPRGNRGEMMLR